MSIFTRFRDIVSSNMNAMLDRAEDPEKLIRLMVHEMEDTLVEIKSSCASAMAERKLHERAAGEARAQTAEWGRRAELAIDKAREDLAREAIARRHEVESRAADLDERAAGFQEVVAKYQSDIEQLEAKLTEARKKQAVLVKRHLQATQRKKARQQIRRVDAASTVKRFDTFQARLDRLEAEADLVDYGRKPDLETEFERLEHGEEVEKELAVLKAKRAGKESGGKK